MILSVSRRTDIPSYYSEWIYNRIKEGFLYVRNPMNSHQISKIDLSPEIVDCIVFWTKNPEPMIARLAEIEKYKYYFQFTITSYGSDIEKNLSNNKNEILQTFKKLSKKIGKEKVIWRYDPIFISNKYTYDYHIKAFSEMVQMLSGYTEKVVISFVDIYKKTRINMSKIQMMIIDDSLMMKFALGLSKIAAKNNMIIETCAENIDLSEYGIENGHCIDKNLIERIVGCQINVGKDKNQRHECGCVESIEVGAYNTCLNGCKYCYANLNNEKVLANYNRYDSFSPLLCSKVTELDKITARKVKSIKVKNQQLNFLSK